MEETDLHFAVRHGDLIAVKRLLKGTEDAATIDSGGCNSQTPLHEATEQGCLHITNLLLKAGANTAATDDRKRTPLHYAAKKGFLEGVCLLIEGEHAGADNAVNSTTCQDMFGATPLLMACKNGHLSVVQYMTSASVANSQEMLSLCDHFGRTPLHIAAKYGHHEVVRLLLERGANASKKDHIGERPLHLALANNFPEAMTVMLLQPGQRGCDMFAKDIAGNTPLHGVRSVSIIKRLLQIVGSTIVKKLLLCRNNKGEVVVEYVKRRRCGPIMCHHDGIKKLIRYLESFQDTRLAVPLDNQENNSAFELSIKLNPNLDKEQLESTESLVDCLVQETIVGEVAYVIVGYLAPIDLFKF